MKKDFFPFESGKWLPIFSKILKKILHNAIYQSFYKYCKGAVTERTICETSLETYS